MRFVVGLLLIVLGISVFVQVPLLNFIFALIVIAIGLKVLTGHGHSRAWRRRKYGYSARRSHGVAHDVDEVRVFGETRRVVEMNDFEEGRAVAVFGGVDLDMSGVKTSEKIVDLELVAVMAGVRVKVPKNWKVVNKSTSVAGGVEDKTSGTGDVVLRIQGAAVLGGIEISN